jgi:ATP-dependent protease ClpP protease subunit
MSTFLFPLKALVLLVFLMKILNIQAATIGMDERGRSYKIDGEITAGDYQKFLKLVAQKRGVRLNLNSKGGNLAEAIKIAELTNRLSLWTYVGKGDLCASACFFIWMNGEYRTANKLQTTGSQMNIGLHRPYLSNPSAEISSTDTQQSVQRKTVVYLEERLVPRRLIDLMMSRASNEIYWMTEADYHELGEYPPHVEELVISKCQYDKNNWNKWFALMDQGRVNEANQIENKISAIEKCAGDIQVDRVIRARDKLFGMGK